MAKIPKNLTDKDMLKDWVEPETAESSFLQAEKKEEKKRRESGVIEPPADLARAGFTPRLMTELGKAMLELKMQLALKGVSHLSYRVKHEGESVIITPVYTKER